ADTAVRPRRVLLARPRARGGELHRRGARELRAVRQGARRRRSARPPRRRRPRAVARAALDHNQRTIVTGTALGDCSGIWLYPNDELVFCAPLTRMLMLNPNVPPTPIAMSFGSPLSNG